MRVLIFKLKQIYWKLEQHLPVTQKYHKQKLDEQFKRHLQEIANLEDEYENKIQTASQIVAANSRLCWSVKSGYEDVYRVDVEFATRPLYDLDYEPSIVKFFAERPGKQVEHEITSRQFIRKAWTDTPRYL